jgi:hypothetical protein
VRGRRSTLVTTLGGPALLGVAAVVFAGAQGGSEAAFRLGNALDRMEGVSARLEMSAVAQMQGSAALGGSFSQTIRAVGEVVPPDRLHLMLDGAGAVEELVIIGHRMWVDGGDGLRLASKVPIGPLSEPQAPLTFVRGPGAPEFAGFGFSRGVLTYRVRLELGSTELQARMRSDQPVDPDARGVLEVEIGLFDGLIRRQSVEVVEPTDPFSGTGLQTVRTAYTIEYWDHGRPLEVSEPK